MSLMTLDNTVTESWTLAEPPPLLSVNVMTEAIPAAVSSWLPVTVSVKLLTSTMAFAWGGPILPVDGRGKIPFLPRASWRG